MSKNFGVILGDRRIEELAKILVKENHNVYTENFEKADIIIGPTPFFLAEEKNNIDNLMQKIKNKILIAGAINQNVLIKAEKNNVKVIDLMQNEELTILNIIATVEGTIKVLIESTDTILQGSKILILGFGRIGKLLSQRLTALSTEVTCAARKPQDLAWIKTYGYNAIDINKLDEKLNKYDIIINTVPSLILDEQKINYIRKDSLLLDLASKPGGIDKKSANEKGIKLIHALALPGKIAPVTSAEFIKETIYKMLEII